MSLVDAGRVVSRRLPGNWGRRLREAGKFTVDYKGARADGLRGWKFARAGRHSDLLEAPFGDGRILVDASDEVLGRAVYIRGGFEREYMRTALEFLTARSITTAGRTFVDVGANIGTSTLDALLHFGFARAISFEPDRHNFRLLRMNLLLNDLEDRADTYLMALSDRDGTIGIERNPGHNADTRIVTPAGDDGGPAFEAVPCARFDTLVESGTIDLAQIGMLWIDAQGHDSHVLAGAATATAAGIPTVVEYWPDELAAAGGLELLEDLVREHYANVVDLRALERGLSDRAVVPAAEIVSLRDRYPGERLTDLLFVR